MPWTVGQIVTLTRSPYSDGGTYRVTEVMAGDTGIWTCTLEPVAGNED